MNEVLESKIGRNPLVLEKIAEQLPAKHLFMLRLTCKMWNQKFTPQLRMKHNPISILLTPIESRSALSEINQRLQLYTKTVQTRQTLPSPYTKYCIELGLGSEEIPNFQKFLTKFGSTITRLDLLWTRCNQFTTLELGKLAFEQAPFLVCLRLTATGFGQDEGPEEDAPNPSFTKPNPNLKKVIADSLYHPCTSFIRLLENVIKQAPHLESVNLCDTSGLPVLSRIKETLADLGKLKTLTLARTSVSWLKLLGELGGRSTNALKLEKFSTTVEYNKYRSGGEQDGLIVNQINPVVVDIHEASQLLYRFLVTQSLTLRKLDIELRDSRRGLLGSRPDVPFQFPRLMDLHTFRLSTNEARLAYGGTSFGDTFPKLRNFQFCYLQRACNKLHTGQFCGTNLEDDVSRLFHFGVTELQLRLTCPEQLIQWPSRFPSVTHLSLWELPRSDQVNEKAKKNCWTLWPKLVKLNNTTRPATTEEASRV